jgi:phage terminase small subunit
MTRNDIISTLRADNPKARADLLAIYADAFIEYLTAQQNIAKNGSIVFHPQTGSPMENPFLAVRDRASKKLQGIRLRVPESLWLTASRS